MNKQEFICQAAIKIAAAMSAAYVTQGKFEPYDEEEESTNIPRRPAGKELTHAAAVFATDLADELEENNPRFCMNGISGVFFDPCWDDLHTIAEKLPDQRLLYTDGPE